MYIQCIFIKRYPFRLNFIFGYWKYPFIFYWYRYIHVRIVPEILFAKKKGICMWKALKFERYAADNSGRVQPNKMICKWCNIHYENYLFILLRSAEGISWLGCFTFWVLSKVEGQSIPRSPLSKAKAYTYIHSYQLITCSNPTLFAPLATYESVFTNLLIKKADYFSVASAEKKLYPG